MQFRANVKANVLSYNQLLAFSYGFRANFPIENSIKMKRRDVLNSMEELIDQCVYEQLVLQLTEFKSIHLMLIEFVAFQSRFRWTLLHFENDL